jgi:hypothetical protein
MKHLKERVLFKKPVSEAILSKEKASAKKSTRRSRHRRIFLFLGKSLLSRNEMLQWLTKTKNVGLPWAISLRKKAKVSRLSDLEN